MIISRPGNIQGSPLLGNSPLRAKKASPVEVLVFPEEVFIRDPEELHQVSVFSEITMNEYLHHRCQIYGQELASTRASILWIHHPRHRAILCDPMGSLDL